MHSETKFKQRQKINYKHTHTHKGTRLQSKVDCFYSNDENLLIIWKNVFTGVHVRLAHVHVAHWSSRDQIDLANLTPLFGKI